MARTSVDRVWFATATLLVAASLVAWWADRPAWTPRAAPYPVFAIWLAAGLLLAGWWRWTIAGETTRWAVAPLTLAVVAPLAMAPAAELANPLGALVAMLLAGLAVVPLATRIAASATGPQLRWNALFLVAVFAGGAVLAGWLGYFGDLPRLWRGLRWGAVAATTLVPAGLVAWELLRGAPRSSIGAQRRSLAALTIVTIGLIPAISAVAASVPDWPNLLAPIAAAALTALLIARFAVLPLARIAASASGQRDRVVAAAEAERERLAFALHDGALAEVTLLIQRLDQQGDTPSAAIARSVADELRALGSELRLPILDDLGTGPALEWLTGRLAQRSGVSVELQQSTTARPPAPVELATYRVAQEAIVNALKHGAAPISVEYLARPGEVVLCVDDAGPGIDRDAPARAEREGRLGILSMTQRAEAIGARLVLATRPDGGTRVRLEWHPS
jgi:signal transduction histidine kinase